MEQTRWSVAPGRRRGVRRAEKVNVSAKTQV